MDQWIISNLSPPRCNLSLMKRKTTTYCFVIKSFKMSVIIEFESENSSRYIDAALNK